MAEECVFHGVEIKTYRVVFGELHFADSKVVRTCQHYRVNFVDVTKYDSGAIAEEQLVLDFSVDGAKEIHQRV